MKVSWSKVANATSYTIYACKDENVSKENQKWYKVKTVSKKTTSYTVKNLKNGKYAGFYVIPTVKIGGKKYKSRCCLVLLHVYEQILLNQQQDFCSSGDTIPAKSHYNSTIEIE